MTEKIKTKILSTARELFRSKGFKQTSMREIISESKVTTGSLYNHFENKEKILETLRDLETKEMFDMIFSIAEEYKNPLLMTALNIEFILYCVQNNEKYAESVITLQNQGSLARKIVKYSTMMNQICFDGYLDSYNDDDLENRALLIKGMIQSIILNYLEGYDSDIESKKILLITTIYRMYDVPDEMIKEIIPLATEIVSTQDFEFFNRL